MGPGHNEREEEYQMGNRGDKHGGYAQGNQGSGNYRGSRGGNSRQRGGGSKRGNAGTGHGGGKSSFASPEMVKAVYITATVPVLAIAYMVGYFGGHALGWWS